VQLSGQDRGRAPASRVEPREVLAGLGVGRFLNQKDDFIHRLSYYIERGRGGPAPRPLYLTPSLYLTLALSAGGEGRGEVPSPFTERVRVR
jgi:hypothetical protein